MTYCDWAIKGIDILADPGALEFSVGDSEWPFRGVLVRIGGAFYAYANVCPHQRHPLNLTPHGFFTVDKTALQCSSHGATFDPTTGQCLAGPCAGKSLKPLSVRIQNGVTYVTAPDSQRDD